LVGFTPSPRQLLDRRDWCIEKIISKNFRKKTGDSEKGYALKFTSGFWLKLSQGGLLARHMTYHGKNVTSDGKKT
jgi:hypothetical protein